MIFLLHELLISNYWIHSDCYFNLCVKVSSKSLMCQCNFLMSLWASSLVSPFNPNLHIILLIKIHIEDKMILDFWFKVVSEMDLVSQSLLGGGGRWKFTTRWKENPPDKIISKLEGILRTCEEMSFEYNLPNYCIMNITVCLIKGWLLERRERKGEDILFSLTIACWLRDPEVVRPRKLGAGSSIWGVLP